MKIVIAEKTSSAAIELFRQEKDWEVITTDQMAGPDALAAHVASADALIVRSAVDVNASLLESAKGLRIIGRAGVGVDNIDLEAATRKGIVVMNTPGANAVAVAEHTFALMLSLEPSVLGEVAIWMDRQRALGGRLFDVVDEYLKEDSR